MKICYIASPGIHTNRWMKYFADLGHEVHLITTIEPQLGNIDNVNVHLLKRYGPATRGINYLINALPLYIQFKNIIRKTKPDVIHAHQIMDTSLLGAVSGFHPFIATPWGSDVLILPERSRTTKWMVRYVLKKADMLTCDADHIQEPLVRLGADPDNIKLIYFGTDVRKFSPEKREDSIRKKLGVNDSPAVISLRRFEPVYDIPSLIKAVPLVLKEYPEVKFLLIERGSQEQELKDLARSLGVAESVNFVGFVPNDELPNYLASADIYVSTSLSDAGLAASTAEAMASGLPVIITDFGDNARWVEDGVNGFTIPLRAPEVLAEKIISLIKDEDIRKKFGARNREIIMERNNWEKEMGKMTELYKEMIEKTRK